MLSTIVLPAWIVQSPCEV